MTTLDIIIASILVCVIIVGLQFLFLYKMHLIKKKNHNYLCRIRSVVYEYPEIFVDKSEELWVLDYLIDYYSDDETALTPTQLLQVLKQKQEIRKYNFLHSWIFNKEIINLEYATLNLDFLSKQKIAK